MYRMQSRSVLILYSCFCEFTFSFFFYLCRLLCLSPTLSIYLLRGFFLSTDEKCTTFPRLQESGWQVAFYCVAHSSGPEAWRNPSRLLHVHSLIKADRKQASISLSLLEFTEEMGKGEVRGVWGWGVAGAVIVRAHVSLGHRGTRSTEKGQEQNVVHI